MQVDDSHWSGEGQFAATVLECLKALSSIELLRIEDTPASRADDGFNFISNEIYVGFRHEAVAEPGRLWGVIPVSRSRLKPVMGLIDLEAQLTTMEEVGPADYADEGMLQYLKAERVIPPYQRRGYKVVEMLRIYLVGAQPRASHGPPQAGRGTGS